MKLTVNDKRQIALIIHLLILYLGYYAIYGHRENWEIALVIQAALQATSCLFIPLIVMLIDGLYGFFCSAEGYGIEKVESKDIFDEMNLPKPFLKFIDFMTFGAGRDLWFSFS